MKHQFEFVITSRSTGRTDAMHTTQAAPLFHLVSVRIDTAANTQLTAYPDTSQHCETIMGKHSAHASRTLAGVAIDWSLVKFNKHHVANGTTKARIFYSLDNRVDGRACVTLYAKDYGHALRNIFGNAYANRTDTNSDVFDQGNVTLFADHPAYATARARALSFKS